MAASARVRGLLMNKGRRITPLKAGLLFLVFGFGLALSAQSRDISGRYNCTGTNPDGSGYRGTVVITRVSGNTYRFDWTVGNNYSGTGTLVGNQISVEWGDTSPAIYNVQPDGSLVGTWANGSGSETLTPAGGNTPPGPPPI